MCGATLKAGGFLPLATSFSENKKFSDYLKEILQDGGFVHFYPEQAMWLKYEQSRPLKKGAFYYASQNNVPIIPIVICFRKSVIKRTLVTVKICKPIYPSNALSQKENCEYMNKLAQKAYDETIIDFYGYDKETYSMDSIQKPKKNKKQLINKV